MSRPSAIFRSSNVNTPSSVRASSRIVIPQDRFPLLDVKQLVMYLENFSFTCSEELLLKPTQQYVLALYAQIAETFLNISDRKLYKAINSVDDNNEYADTLHLVGLQKIMYNFLHDCGIDDFNIMDIIKPDPERLRRILSCVVNFARFRHENLHLLKELHSQNQQVVKAYKDLQDQIQVLQDRTNKLDKYNESVDLAKIKESNRRLEDEMRKLKRREESIKSVHSEYKEEKSTLLSRFQTIQYNLAESQKELDNLKSMTNVSPDEVLEANTKLQIKLEQEQEKFALLEQRSRNLSVSVDTFTSLETEFRNLLKLLEELESDIKKGEDLNVTAQEGKELTEARRFQIREYERRAELTLRQIENSERKLERLRATNDEKKGKLEAKLQDLHNKYSTLVAERDMDEHSLQSKRKEISSFESKIGELKLQHDDEIKNLNREIMRLNNHIKSYLAQMAKKL